MKQILETARLALREMEMSDLDFIADLLGNSQVMEFWPKPYTKEEARQWLIKQQARYRKDGFGYWLVLEKKMNQPIGQTGLLKMTIEERPEIALGYIFHYSFWNKGYAGEAASACVEYAFQKLRVSRVIALIRPENVASKKVAEKLRMMPAGITEYAGLKHLIYVIEKNQKEF